MCVCGMSYNISSKHMNHELHRTICAHDHRGKILGVSIDARLAIDQTSAAISTKKRGRGRPADSPGTKVRKAFEKKILLLF